MVGKLKTPTVRIDCESAEILRIENSGADRHKQIVLMLPSWLMSMLTHVVLLLLLAFLTFPAVGNSLPQILTVLPAPEPEEVVFLATDSKIDDEQVLDLLEDSFDETFDFEPKETEAEQEIDITQFVVSLPRTEPKFYGTEGEGDRYAFVIDRSSSMTGAKFEDARNELLKSLKQLDSNQYFYVVFFDRGMLEMFGRKKVRDMLPATAKNIKQAEYWIRDVKVGQGTMPYQSIRRVLELSPDTIFLLSDGQFNGSDNTVAYLLEHKKVDGQQFDKKAHPFRLNTIGLHHQDGTLKTLAEEFDGAYQFIAQDASKE
ncbi:MAG: hypothetical protein KDB27_11590 [Planctomycetales bacterium]|nr:hypothetical protein [Planctomycetales bacterium]